MKIYSALNRAQIQQEYERRKSAYDAKVSSYRNLRQEYTEAYEKHINDFSAYIKEQFNQCKEILPDLKIWVNARHPNETIITFEYKDTTIYTTHKAYGYGHEERDYFRWQIVVTLSEGKLTTTSDERGWTNIDIFSVDNMEVLSKTMQVLKIIADYDWNSLLLDFQSKYPSTDALNSADLELKQLHSPKNDSDILEAAISTAIGKDVLLFNRPWDFYKILSKTGEYYEVAMWSPGRNTYADYGTSLALYELETNDFKNILNVTIDVIALRYINYPFETITQDELISILHLTDKEQEAAFNALK